MTATLDALDKDGVSPTRSISGQGLDFDETRSRRRIDIGLEDTTGPPGGNDEDDDNGEIGEEDHGACDAREREKIDEIFQNLYSGIVGPREDREQGALGRVYVAKERANACLYFAPVCSADCKIVDGKPVRTWMWLTPGGAEGDELSHDAAVAQTLHLRAALQALEVEEETYRVELELLRRKSGTRATNPQPGIGRRSTFSNASVASVTSQDSSSGAFTIPPRVRGAAQGSASTPAESGSFERSLERGVLASACAQPGAAASCASGAGGPGGAEPEVHRTTSQDQGSPSRQSWIQSEVREEALLDKVTALLDEADNFAERLIKNVHFGFTYKARWHTGRAQHIACLSRSYDKAPLLLRHIIMSFGASVTDMCSAMCYGNKSSSLPIHLAAGCGHCRVLRELLQLKANPDGKTSLLIVADRSQKRPLQSVSRQTVVKAKAAISNVVCSRDANEAALTKVGVLGSIASPRDSEKDSEEPHAEPVQPQPEPPPEPAQELEGYAALHECAFFHQAEAAEVLLKAKAQVDSRNREGQTPLHQAARWGAHGVARLLVSKDGNLDAVDKNGLTPLAVAVDFGNFPIRKMYFLTKRSLDDVLLVAKKSPAAAAELMRDPDTEAGSRVHHTWRSALAKEAPGREDICADWRLLMRISPVCAEDLLEALTVVPEVDDKRHPLPSLAYFRPDEVVRCAYKNDDRWMGTAVRGVKTPSWHDGRRGIAPRKPGTESDGASSMGPAKRAYVYLLDGLDNRIYGVRCAARIRVKMVLIPNMLCKEVFFCLRQTDHHHIFVKIATRALIDTVWHQYVARFYYTHVGYRMAEIFILLWWVLNPPTDSLNVQLTWSFLFATACREFLYELLEIRGILSLLMKGELGEDHLFVRFMSTWLTLGNIFDLAAIMLLLSMAIISWHGRGSGDGLLDVDSELLAVVVLTRWVQLMIACRAFSAVGQKLLPIFQSTVSMGGIMCVFLFFFMGFLHAFWALGGASTSWHEVLIGAVRFLLAGDGDGLDMVLGLGNSTPEQPNIMAVMMLVAALCLFCIWIMNLFIAGTDQAYEQALEFVHARFQQERASICLNFLFRPSIYWARSVPDWLIRSFMCFVVLPSWYVLIRMEVVPTPATSAMLSVAFVLSEALMMKHPNQKLRSPFAPHISVEDASAQGKLGDGKEDLHLVVGDEKRVDEAGATPAPEVLPLPKWYVKELTEAATALPHVPAPTKDDPEPPRQPPPQFPGQLRGQASSQSMGTDLRTSSGSCEGAALATAVSRAPDNHMFLWICQREDYDEVDYWPAEYADATMTKIEGRVSSLKRDGMLRSRKVMLEVMSLKRKSEQLNVALQNVRGDISKSERTLDTRLANLEQLISRLVPPRGQDLHATYRAGGDGTSPSSPTGPPGGPAGPRAGAGGGPGGRPADRADFPSSPVPHGNWRDTFGNTGGMFFDGSPGGNGRGTQPG